MKNLFKKGAVAAAVAGSLMVSGVASADSLLAPLVIGTSNVQTYFAFKVRGAGTVNQAWAGSASALHYTWFKKGTSISALTDLTTGCDVENSTGAVSSYDMVFQPAVVAPTVGGDVPPIDKSKPSSYAGGNFVGFAVLTDMANANNDKDVKNLANEGEMSGFAYVVDASNGMVLDYKLLNNHRSKVEGNFSAGFISKSSIDYSWLPTTVADTQWLTVVVGKDMTKAEAVGSWKGTVEITQGKSALDSISPSVPTDTPATNNMEVGVYDNDERVWSGNKALKVTCMGMYDRSAFLLSAQQAQTVKGGWRRAAIIADEATGASGAITYKMEELTIASFATSSDKPEAALSDAGLVAPIPGSKGIKAISFQVETSGHLSSSPEAHPNRPY